jgi:hypothetical protein
VKVIFSDKYFQNYDITQARQSPTKTKEIRTGIFLIIEIIPGRMAIKTRSTAITKVTATTKVAKNNESSRQNNESSRKITKVVAGTKMRLPRGRKISSSTPTELRKTCPAMDVAIPTIPS